MPFLGVPFAARDVHYEARCAERLAVAHNPSMACVRIVRYRIVSRLESLPTQLILTFVGRGNGERVAGIKLAFGEDGVEGESVCSCDASSVVADPPALTTFIQREGRCWGAGIDLDPNAVGREEVEAFVQSDYDFDCSSWDHGNLACADQAVKVWVRLIVRAVVVLFDSLSIGLFEKYGDAVVLHCGG